VKRDRASGGYPRNRLVVAALLGTAGAVLAQLPGDRHPAKSAFPTEPSRPSLVPPSPDPERPRWPWDRPEPTSKAPADGASTAPQRSRDRPDYRPITDWPRRISLLIRQGQSDHAFAVMLEAGKALDPRDRAELTQQALNDLAARAEASNAPGLNLRKVQSASSNARLLQDPAVDRALAALEKRLEGQVLTQELRAVAGLLEKDYWVRAADRWPVRLAQTEMPAEVRSALEEVSLVGRQSHALDQLRAALRTAADTRPAQTAEALQGIDLEQFSPDLKEAVRRLRGLTELWAAGAAPWVKTPSGESLRRSVADFRTEDPDLAARLQQDLAVKLFLEGFPRQARELLPADGPAGHARQLLRDAAALVAGRGEIETGPARDALAAAERANGRRPPPGVRALLAEEDGAAWRPPTPSSGRTEADALSRAVRQEPALRDAVRAALQREQDRAAERGAEAFARIRTACREREQAEEQDRKLFTHLETALQRPLTPVERVIAGEARGQGQTPSETLSALAPYQAAARLPDLTPGVPVEATIAALDQLWAVGVARAVATAGGPPRPGLALAVELAAVREGTMDELDPDFPLKSSGTAAGTGTDANPRKRPRDGD
jgi:hypothetical protein